MTSRKKKVQEIYLLKNYKIYLHFKDCMQINLVCIKTKYIKITVTGKKVF